MPATRRSKPSPSKRDRRETAYPFPILSATTHDLRARLIRVNVLNCPRFPVGGGTIWTVDEEPASPLQSGTLIILYNDNGDSGIGRISAVTDLRQHWVTFTLAGASPPAYVRTPVVWAKLADLAAHTHSVYFNELPPYPGPPEKVRRRLCKEGHHNEPPMERTIPGEDGSIEARITKITRGSRRGLD